MILVNIPISMAWILLGYATSVQMILAAVFLLGLGNGLMEAPVITYLGEIW